MVTDSDEAELAKQIERLERQNTEVDGDNDNPDKEEISEEEISEEEISEEEISQEEISEETSDFNEKAAVSFSMKVYFLLCSEAVKG